MKLLLTGFEPFGEMDINPSHLLMEWAEKQTFPGVEVKTLSLPVVYDRCTDKSDEVIQSFQPDAVLHFGVAAGRAAINVERVAVNLNDTKETADNEGNTPQDEPIEAGGPDALFATVPTRVMMEQLQRAGIPAVLSYTAGTYICNTSLYQTLRLIEKEQLHTKAGFIHLPALPEMVAGRPLPSMALSLQQEALRVIVTTMREEERHD